MSYRTRNWSEYNKGWKGWKQHRNRKAPRIRATRTYGSFANVAEKSGRRQFAIIAIRFQKRRCSDIKLPLVARYALDALTIKSSRYWYSVVL